MNIFEIDKAMLECVDMETGEIIDAELLEKLEMDREKKISNVLHWIKNLRTDLEAYEKLEKEFKAKKDSAKNKIESLTHYLEAALNGDDFECEDKAAKVTWRPSESVEITDVWALPEEFRKYKDPEADKTALKKALKALKDGEAIEGAFLLKKQNIQIK